MGDHYVPQFYLHGFESGGGIRVFDRNEQRSYGTQVKSTANENSMYSRELERHLANDVETPANYVLTKIRERKPLDEVGRKALAHYLTVLMRRVPTGRTRAMSLVPQAADEVLAEAHAQLDMLAYQDPSHAAWVSKRKVAVSQVVSQLRRDPHPPCDTSLYNWVRLYTSKGKQVDALINRTDQSGNRTPRLDPEVQELLDRAMDEHYLHESRPTLQKTDAWLRSEIRSINRNRPPEEAIEAPSYTALCHWAKHQVDPYDRISRRHGVQAAMREFRGRGLGPVAEHPLSRVEIDHTSLDINIVDDDGKRIGRPTFTWVIDCYSRCILGFYLSWGQPSSIAVLETLDLAMRDKTQTLADLPEARGFSWSMAGVPTEIVTDNGAEFGGRHFKDFCAAHMINIQFCPPATPWFKGKCERFVRTLNTGLIHRLPGTTFSNPKMRGSYRSEELARLTLPELDRLIRLWIATSYHESRHRTLGMAPRQAWQDGIAQRPVRQLENERVAEVALGMSYEPALNGGSLQFEGRRYFAPELVPLCHQLGRNKKVSVRCSPRDISIAYVKNPLTRDWVTATCATPGVVKGMALDLLTGLGVHNPSYGATQARTERLSTRRSRPSCLPKRTSSGAKYCRVSNWTTPSHKVAVSLMPNATAATASLSTCRTGCLAVPSFQAWYGVVPKVRCRRWW